MPASEAETVMFVPFSSTIDIGFWHELCQKKLEEFKLDDSKKIVYGSYVNDHPDGISCSLSVDYEAFSSGKTYPLRVFPTVGEIHNKNTVEDFKNCDKKHMMEEAGKQIWSDIMSGKALETPSCLVKFIMLTYADLKKYHFYYWFCFPALTPVENVTSNWIKPITDVLNEEQVSSLQLAYEDFTMLTKDVVVMVERTYVYIETDMFTQQDHQFFLVKYTEGNGKVELAKLQDFERILGSSGGATSKMMFGFSDPSTLSKNPGWPLRNFLALISHHWGSRLDDFDVLCYRDRVRSGHRESLHSIVVQVRKLPPFSDAQDVPKVVGWEKNQRQKLLPMSVDLSSTLDPVRLAESAVDLNLKLMRWRLVPDIDLDTIATTKCLLLGSGTLGCNVARALMGWGFKNITFLDNAKVSYSNPVRQSLFEFEDCKNGGKRKAKAAAEALKRIFPGMESSFHEATVPMPGHSIGESDSEIERVRKDVELLENLIETHDVVFLLMDTRESRWLPSVIATCKRKIIINAALGFDTFMVMRHGMKTDASADSMKLDPSSHRFPGHLLGCYFCSDVVAPGDSTRDRTLDQQCTVSRPGISMMASALAVELLVSILQHPQRGLAAAETSAKDNHLEATIETPLGLIPHQIRGFLSRFQVVLPACLAFDKCTACSDKVLEKYREDGFDFLVKVFNLPKYLEEISGLVELQRMTSASEIWELSDDDDEEEIE